MSEAGGCYSSARANGGQVWLAARHAQRLARDARLLGLGDVDEAGVLDLLSALALPTRGGPDAKIRIDAHFDPELAIRLSGTSSPIGAESPTWRCVAAIVAHPGASPTSSAKRSDRALYDAAFVAAREAGVDEALLFDAADRLVEGTRSNLIVVRDDAAIVTPPLACGAQAGIARALLLERIPQLREADVTRAELAAAIEIIACNAVRGVRPVVALEGRAVGDGRPGPCAERLAVAFASAC